MRLRTLSLAALVFAHLQTQAPEGVTVLRDVMVPMRDGIRLATDVYLPRAAAGATPARLPAIMERTPYGKAGAAGSAANTVFHDRRHPSRIILPVIPPR